MSSITNTPTNEIIARSRLVTDLLASRFPALRTRTKDLDKRGLAAAMGVSHETIYRATRGVEEITATVARQLVVFSHENQDAESLYLKDLLPFMFHDWDVVGEESDIDDLLA